MPSPGDGCAAPLTFAVVGFDRTPAALEGVLSECGLEAASDAVDVFTEADLLLVDIRAGLSDALLREIEAADAVKIAFGDPPANDPVAECAFDEFLPPDAFETNLRRRLTLAVRYASARRSARTGEADEALRLANGSLQFALRRFESLFQGLPTACFTVDTEGTIHEWNGEASRLFRMEGYEACYRSASELFGLEWSPESLRARVEEGGQFEWNWLRPGGVRVWMQCRLLPLFAPDGTPSAIVATNLDVTARVRAQRQAQAYGKRLERQAARLARANALLEAQTLTDALTGLANRRRFDEALDCALERERRGETGFSLLLVDLDRFKTINDEFGHHGGDEVLRITAKILLDVSRKHERPMRLGGEEFAMILEGADPAQAVRVAERIRLRMAEHGWPFRAVSASLGLATSRPGDSPRTIFARADEALYQAKEEGRDCVRFAA